MKNQLCLSLIPCLSSRRSIIVARASFLVIIIILICMQIPLAVVAQDFGWAKDFGGTGADFASANATDNSGNVYVVGSFENTVDFNPGGGVANISAIGGDNGFLLKLNSSGNYLWASPIGGPGTALCFNIAIRDEYVYVIGSYTSTVDFDPGSGVDNKTAVGTDVFLSKYDTAGNYQWTKTIDAFGLGYSQDLIIDQEHNIFIAGVFEDSTDFDPDSTTHVLHSGSMRDVFLLKLDSNGHFLNAIGFPGTNQERVGGMNLAPDGSIYLAIIFLDSIDVDPSIAVSNMVSVLGQEMTAIIKIDSSFDFEWAKGLDGLGRVYVESVKLDQAENIYMVGAFHDTGDFDPGPGNSFLTAYDGYDGFFLKLDSNGNFVWVRQFEGESSDWFYHVNYDGQGGLFVTGSFQDSIDIDPGPSKLVFKIGNGNGGVVAMFDTAGNFHWGRSYGGFTGTIIPSQVAFGPNESLHLSQSFQDSVDFDPGPGVFYLDAAGNKDCSVLKLVKCSNSYDTIHPVNCVEYFSPSGNYKWIASGTYLDTIPNISFCDSVITVDLTIVVVDTSVSINGITLTANADTATYQWLDCGNQDTVIPGEINQSFIPIVDGTYAVEVTQQGCVDTSACYQITSRSTFDEKVPILAFPNPTNGIVSVLLSGKRREIVARLSDVMGRRVFERVYRSTSKFEFEVPAISGMYLLTVQVENQPPTSLRIIRQ